jgi:hypothetical protein
VKTHVTPILTKLQLRDRVSPGGISLLGGGYHGSFGVKGFDL